jgi:uncharacterized membrane protein
MTSLSPREPKRTLAATLVSAVAVAFAVCVIGVLPACGGSSSQRSDASVGKQLASLREAYDKGVITREEYERERRRIVGDW